MTLAQLRALPGASAAEAAWAAERAAQPGWLSDLEAQAAACDGSVAPVVTGHVDWAALDRMTKVYLAIKGLGPDPTSAPVAGGRGAGGEASETPDTDSACARASTTACGCTCGRCTCPARTPLSPATMDLLRQTMLRLAADVLSGPSGLASLLRTTQLAGEPGSGPSALLAVPISLDAGDAAPAIPPALRRAVLARHHHCCFAGCTVPAAQCHIHHFIPRSRGGRTKLGNLGPVCEFHHLIVIHAWGWVLTPNPDGTTTAISPHGRVLHSHSPPSQAA
jgi:hypothetical protein